MTNTAQRIADLEQELTEVTAQRDEARRQVKTLDNALGAVTGQCRKAEWERDQAQTALERVSTLADQMRDELAALRPNPDHHVYLSTGCLHGEHGYCQRHTGLSGAKTPAQCKFCAAPCTCPCHSQA
ncbi:hypothetical protein ACFV3R_25050 [Streptomyces sp. NPDC059740]|uniref:hypothetical protein n=1 Tax=Streptomyces sp. NPDC059740 TaxID=3346926 RepID=UPI00366A0B61